MERETTQQLPASASWEGLERRVQLAEEVEAESRRIVLVLLEAAVKAGVRIRAVGVEKDVAILEIDGERAKRRIQKALPAEILRSVKYGEQGGLIRMMIANRVARERRRPGHGASGGAHE